MIVRRGIPLVLALLVLGSTLGSLCAVRSSTAVFSSSGTTGVRAAADRIQEWLHVYSQGSDPDGLTGYATRRGSSPAVPAATGRDETIAVHLGGFTGTADVTVNRVVTIQAVPSFPVTGITQITARAYLVADPASGRQPISGCGFAPVGGTQRRNPVNLRAGQKQQMNLRLRLRGLTLGTLYEPRVQIVVTYSGMTVTYYRYELPVKIWYGSGPGPD
ncbi:MAG: hypothetical protein FJ000_06010 [Actinobacteria bacterium]|nr:hypothetical protein [Actinomycetota bacterium]